jgi:hypothetical protein
MSFGRYDAGQWYTVRCHDEDAHQRRVTYEEVAALVHRKTVGAHDAETRDCKGEHKPTDAVALPGAGAGEKHSQNLATFVVVPSAWRGSLHTLFSRVIAT